MAVNAPPTRRPALTRLDEELLARLLQQAQTPIEAYTRESALGVPWGSLANSLVGGMLAGRERRRQEEKIKRQDDYADAVTRITSMDTDLMPGQVSISPQGTFETLPTDVEGGGVSTFTRPDILQSQQQINTLRNDPEMMERLRSRGVEVPMVGSEFEATTEAPLGIPYAPQAATLTVGEEFPEDSNELTRFLSGKEKPVTLNQNANVALTQALRGAGYEPLEYMQYMQNEERLRGLQPKISERSDVYDPDGNRYQAVKITSGNRTFYSLLDDEGNPTNIPMPSDYTATPPKEIKIENNIKVLDTETGKLTFATDSEINDNPDRYVPAPDEPSQYNLSFTRQLNRLIEQNNLLPENQKKSMVELEAEADNIVRKIVQVTEASTNVEDDKDYEEFDLPPLDIDAMSAGDFQGYIDKASNVISGFFGVEPFSPSAKSTQSNTAILKASNVVLAVPLVKKLSSKGSVYTQEKVKAVLPSPNISNSANAARLRALIPLYKQREIEAQGIVANRGQDYGNKASEALKEARNDLSIIKAVIPNLEQALANYDALLIKNTDKDFKDTSTEELLELLLKSENK